jgi:hypothetical protein
MGTSLYSSSHLSQDIDRTQYRNPETAARCGKMLDIKGHQRVRSTVRGSFGHHLVTWIAHLKTPKEMNVNGLDQKIRDRPVPAFWIFSISSFGCGRFSQGT